jgi:hypothetical protein
VGLYRQTENSTHGSEKKNSAPRGLQRTGNGMESEISDLSESAVLESPKQICQSRRKKVKGLKALVNKTNGSKDL